MFDHCPACGNPLCAHCRARFCPQCGAPLSNAIDLKLDTLRAECRDRGIVIFSGTVGTTDAAKLTGIPKDTLKRWLAEGKYPELKTKIGGRWRYELKALSAFLVGNQEI